MVRLHSHGDTQCWHSNSRTIMEKQQKSILSPPSQPHQCGIQITNMPLQFKRVFVHTNYKQIKKTPVDEMIQSGTVYFWSVGLQCTCQPANMHVHKQYILQPHFTTKPSYKAKKRPQNQSTVFFKWGTYCCLCLTDIWHTYSPTQL